MVIDDDSGAVKVTETDRERPLTKNQQMVLDVLERTENPLSAYSILDELRADGFRAPLQVYRALERLIADGKVHRLESLNAFVACSHPHCDGEETVAFAICSKCGHADEVNDPHLGEQLARISGLANFRLSHATVELRGTCAACRNQPSS